MLTSYCHNVLKLELAKSDYNGKTADQAWTWLTQPTSVTIDVPTNYKLTPLAVAKAIGPVKANNLAGKVKAAFPNIADSLLADGPNASDALTIGFLNACVDANLLQSDINILVALGVVSTTTVTPARFPSRFTQYEWPHIDSNGGIGNASTPALMGFPNSITRDEFDAAWMEVRS